MVANPLMHKCVKKTKAEEAQKTTEKEEEQTEDVGMNLPQFDKGATQILLKFLEWMISNDMGSENTTNLYLAQVKGFLINYEENHASYIADCLLSPVSTKTLLPMPIGYLLALERSSHTRKNFYSGMQKFIEFLSYRFDAIYLIDTKITNEEKYLYLQNFDSVHARLRSKRKKIFKEAQFTSLMNQADKMTDESNLKFNTALMVNIIQKFLSSEAVQQYMKMFKAVDEKTDAKVSKTNALGTLEVRNLAICLCHIFGGGKRADAYMNMLVSEFDERKEVDGSIPISVFKHKTAQSGSAFISYKKGSFMDIVMTMYRRHFRIRLQPKLVSDDATNILVPLQDNDFFFVSDQARKFKRLTPALEWMRDLLIRSYPDDFSIDSFKVQQCLTNVPLTHSQCFTNIFFGSTDA
jgi:hypothetical protein